MRQRLLQAVQEVSSALAAMETQAQVADLKQQEFESYNLATTYSQELVNNGLGNYLEIILANERPLTAELEYIQARLRQLSSKVQLYRSLGGGWQ